MAIDSREGVLQEPAFKRTSIKNWPADERPREKLLKHGSSSLADAELVAILLRTGSGRNSAIDLAKGMLQDARSLDVIASKNASELMRMKGIGKAKAVELLAAFEIGRRVETRRQKEKVIVRSPEDVAQLMIPKMRHLTSEEFYVLVLDAKNGLREEIRLSLGTLNASLVHPREVFKTAIDHRAAAVIVVHNHPSGNLEPSREDIEITRQLAEAGKIIGIPLHDHVIVSADGFTSMAERGLIP
jgi:DNA repair protein RadC